MKSLLIDESYIAATLDARGYVADEKTVKHALEVWLEYIAQTEDNYFSDILDSNGVELKDKN